LSQPLGIDRDIFGFGNLPFCHGQK